MRGNINENEGTIFGVQITDNNKPYDILITNGVFTNGVFDKYNDPGVVTKKAWRYFREMHNRFMYKGNFILGLKETCMLGEAYINACLYINDGDDVLELIPSNRECNRQLRILIKRYSKLGFKFSETWETF